MFCSSAAMRLWLPPFANGKGRVGGLFAVN